MRLRLAHVALLFTLFLSSCSSSAPPIESEILWDDWGVPHIYADSWDSVFYSFGWAQMHSHGDLVLKLYGEARGRAAEYWGADYIESDRYLRVMGVPSRAEEWLEQQSPSMRAYLEAFARGMNDYASQNLALLNEKGHIVLPVEPSDILAHLQRVVHIEFVGQTIRPKLNALGVAGSNAWAIAPKKSKSGNAMLLANPHLPWSSFFRLYEAHLVAPGLDVYGAAFVGIPVLGIAFNDFLGWTHTNNTMDGADLYEVFVRDEGYLWPPIGEGPSYVREFDAFTDTMKVKQADGTLEEQEFVIRSTDYGPVVGERGSSVLVAKIVGFDQPHFLDQYWNMARSKSFEHFEEQLRRLQNPAFNLLYADRDGRIMYLFGGRHPFRREEANWQFWQGLIPGNHPGFYWNSTHSYSDLPKVVDPASGWVQNANDPPWSSTFPSQLDPYDFPFYLAPREMSFRAQRSVSMLDTDELISLDKMIEYKHSTRMELADRVLDDLIPAARRRGGIARRAAGVLNAWDRASDADSRGAVLFEAWVQEIGLSPNTFQTPWDEDNPRTTPDGLKNSREAADALVNAAVRVEETYGALDVPWGDVYRFQYEGKDFPANGAPGSLGVFRVIGFSREDNVYKATRGDSFVAAIEFSDPVQAQVLLAYGNSSQPHSKHQGDQIELLSNKELRPAWRTRSEIEAHLESVETLQFKPVQR